MSRGRIATRLISVLLAAASAVGQDSVMPGTPAASQLLGSKKQNAPCRLPTPDEPRLFDVHQYLPIGAGVHAARPVHAPDPEYSEEARKAQINGNVVTALAINQKGGIDDIKIVCSSDRRFEQPTLDAIRQWKFAPGTKDGIPVAVQIYVEMGFRLH